MASVWRSLYFVSVCLCILTSSNSDDESTVIVFVDEEVSLLGPGHSAERQ